MKSPKPIKRKSEPQEWHISWCYRTVQHSRKRDPDVEGPLCRRHERHRGDFPNEPVVPSCSASRTPATDPTASHCAPCHLSLCICVWSPWIKWMTICSHHNGNSSPRQAAPQKYILWVLQQRLCPGHIFRALSCMDHIDERNKSHANFR